MPRKKKAKPATRGERVQMRLCDCRLVDVRENEDWARESAVIERAMVRVEMRERERCELLADAAVCGGITYIEMRRRIKSGGV